MVSWVLDPHRHFLHEENRFLLATHHLHFHCSQKSMFSTSVRRLRVDNHQTNRIESLKTSCTKRMDQKRAMTIINSHQELWGQRSSISYSRPFRPWIASTMLVFPEAQANKKQTSRKLQTKKTCCILTPLKNLFELQKPIKNLYRYYTPGAQITTQTYLHVISESTQEHMLSSCSKAYWMFQHWFRWREVLVTSVTTW